MGHVWCAELPALHTTPFSEFDEDVQALSNEGRVTASRCMGRSCMRPHPSHPRCGGLNCKLCFFLCKFGDTQWCQYRGLQCKQQKVLPMTRTKAYSVDRAASESR
mmetsp:Transcript_137593/g.357500  ORF Transcript_137593/g.357500 Transcript_137593/m.357500 type:complete len:105 (+) Transcript_137593:180-494(+)